MLIDRGVQNFADKVFKIEEKKPRIGFAVVHGFLGQDGPEIFGMPGLKEALPARDFEGRDIVLRKMPRFEAAALERDESRYEQLELQKRLYDRSIKELEAKRAYGRSDKKYWETTSVEDINKKYVLVPDFGRWIHTTHEEVEEIRRETRRTVPTRRITQEYKDAEIAEWVEYLDAYESELALKKERLDKTNVGKSTLRVENLAEQRRITDVREKFKRLLADIDLLVLPRATFRDLMRGQRIPADIHPLETDHIEAIKDFMKEGKPVLFCLGPMNAGEGERFDPSEDSIEKLLGSFDVQLPNQAILFASEEDAMEEARERLAPPGGAVIEIPPALFEWKKLPEARFLAAADGKPAPPIRSSLQITLRGLGEKSKEGFRINYFRPVYVVRKNWAPEAVASAVSGLTLPWPAGTIQGLVDFHTRLNKKFDEKSVFLMSDTDCWNEDQPIPSRDFSYTPRFKRPNRNDVAKGTVQEKRRGPFPVGVALEANVPLEWYADDGLQKPQKVRLAVIGQGGVFVGDKLSPMREKMFVDVANWLLGRDTLLAQGRDDLAIPACVSGRGDQESLGVGRPPGAAAFVSLPRLKCLACEADALMVERLFFDTPKKKLLLV